MQKKWTNNLGARRRRAKLTQDKLAALASVEGDTVVDPLLSAQQIALYEQGYRKPGEDRLLRIERHVGVTKWRARRLKK